MQKNKWSLNIASFFLDFPLFFVFYCFFLLSFNVFLLGFLVINVITKHFEMLSGFLYAGIFCWIYDTLKIYRTNKSKSVLQPWWIEQKKYMDFRLGAITCNINVHPVYTDKLPSTMVLSPVPQVPSVPQCPRSCVRNGLEAPSPNWLLICPILIEPDSRYCPDGTSLSQR